MKRESIPFEVPLLYFLFPNLLELFPNLFKLNFCDLPLPMRGEATMIGETMASVSFLQCSKSVGNPSMVLSSTLVTRGSRPRNCFKIFRIRSLPCHFNAPLPGRNKPKSPFFARFIHLGKFTSGVRSNSTRVFMIFLWRASKSGLGTGKCPNIKAYF